MDTYPFDKLLVLADGAAPAVNGIGQVGGVNRILDMGAPLTRSDLGITGELGRVKLAIIIDVSAIFTTNANDYYNINVMGSNTANGSTGVVLCAIILGNAASIPGGITSTAGRYILFVDMVQADVDYEYLYLSNSISGTANAITFTAFASKWPDGQ